MGTQCVVQDTTLNIAMWLERRLDMSLGFHFPAARLYGIVLNDPLGLADDTGQAARTSFIDESDDVYELMAGSAGVIARSFGVLTHSGGVPYAFVSPADDLVCPQLNESGFRKHGTLTHDVSPWCRPFVSRRSKLYWSQGQHHRCGPWRIAALVASSEAHYSSCLA